MRFLLAFLMMSGFLSLNSQSPLKLVRSDNSWINVGYSLLNNSSKSYRYRFTQRDTVINGKSYLELMYSEEPEGDTFVGTKEYFREEDNKIYGYGLWAFSGNEEALLYDFNLKHGDTIRFGDFPLMEVISDSTEFITLFNGKRRKIFRFSCDGRDDSWPMWIEGIGSVLGLSSSVLTCAFDVFESLSCFYQNDTLIYQSPNFEKCWVTTSTLDYEKDNISVYPNPTTGILYISGISNKESINIKNLSGETLLKTNNQQEIDINILSAGVYIVEINQNHSVINKKIVKI